MIDKILKLNKIIENNQVFRAHSRENNGASEYEGLDAHLHLTCEYFKKICDEKDLNSIFDKIYEKLFSTDEYKELFFEMLINTIYLHDVGKVNPRFQIEKMKNSNIEEDFQIEDTNHSSYGAWIYYKLFYNKINNIAEEVESENISLLINILLSNIGIIIGHHGKLKSKENIIKDLEKFNVYDDIDFFVTNFILNNKDLDVEDLQYSISIDIEEDKKRVIYIYSRLLFGLLTQADILATIDYTEGIKVEDFGSIKNRDLYIREYNKNDITESIRSYEKGELKYKKDDINELRTQMFLEAENNLDVNKNIFMLEAPTGAGKTNISINLALNLLKCDNSLNKIFYAFPFNTLVEQTYNSLKDLFNNNSELLKDISIYNSIHSFSNLSNIGMDSEELDYSKLYREYQFLYYPITISTNIKLFDILFGNTKSSYYPLPLVANSIIILDEIQSYKNKIWFEIIDMLTFYAEILNIKIIIMSATLPNIKEVIISEGKSYLVKSLIENPKKYYGDIRFKQRVKCDFSLIGISGENYEEKKLRVFKEITHKIEKHKDGSKLFLVEFIKKATANDYYNYLVEECNCEDSTIMLLTGDTNVSKRKEIIENIKLRKTYSAENNDDFILVATQVVEAGVDIDMDYGFKDTSLLDSEEQFLGRINRNFKNGDSIAYFFSLDKAEKIYKNEVRTERKFTLVDEEIRNLLIEKEFKDYYSLILEELRERNRTSTENMGEKHYKNLLRKMDYSGLGEHFKLIDNEDKHTIFLNIKDEEIESSVIWEEYKNLLFSKLSIAERRVKLIQLRSKMDPYTYEIYNIPSGYQDYAGGIYYFYNGEKYMKNGEFDSDLMKDSNKDYDFY